MATEQSEIVHKAVEPLLMAGIRIRGKYEECGRLFKQLGKKFGFNICGPAFLLYYDEEQKEILLKSDKVKVEFFDQKKGNFILQKPNPK